jgi:hypothetical protein
VSSVASNHLSNLPQAPENGIFYSQKEGQESIEFEKITMLAESLNITITDIIKYSDDGSEFKYNSSYIDIITAATMQDIISQGIIEHEALSINSILSITIPEKKEIAKDTTGKILRDEHNKPLFNIVAAKNITQEIGESAQDDLVKELFLSSDQAQELQQYLSPEEVVSIPVSKLSKWVEFSQMLRKEENTKILEYLLKADNGLMLNKFLKHKEGAKESLLSYTIYGNDNYLHICLQLNMQNRIPCQISRAWS